MAEGKRRDGQPVLLADKGDVARHEVGMAKHAILLDNLGAQGKVG